MNSIHGKTEVSHGMQYSCIHGKTGVSHGIHGREQGTVFMVRLKSHTECSIHVFMVRLNKSHMEYMEESRETEPAVTRL